MKNPVSFINRFLPFVAILSMFAFASCKDDEGSETILGETQNIGTGSATAYITNDKNGNPEEVGVVLSEETYQSLNDNYETLSLDLPTGNNKTPYVHAMFDWAPFGHEPSNVYTEPHFDVHFYMTPSSEREAIGLEDSIEANILPDLAYFPEGYFPTGVVPTMGNHWLDSAAPELDPEHPHTFDETFIFGSFDGEMTFWEPMITKAFVEAEVNFEKTIKQPTLYNVPGSYYPTTFGFAKDNKKKERRFFLNNFVKR